MLRRSLLLVVLLGALSLPLTGLGAAPACPAPSWSMYGHDLRHSFSQSPSCAAVTPATVARLVPKWAVHTHDSVSASPTVVGGILYVGSWDGTFYALDAATGQSRWTFHIDDDHNVAFGRIVSTAAVADVAGIGGNRQRVVVFGGGAHLYALDAADGHVLADLDVDPRTAADQARQAANPPTVEIESSPAIVGDRVFFGMDVHNDAHVGRTGLLSARLVETRDGQWHLDPLWKFDPETAQTYAGAAGLTVGSGQGWGCGGVWSSPAVDTAQGLVVFGTASCSNASQAMAAGENYAEAMFAVRLADGAFVWRYRPADAASTPADRQAVADRDDDFGASANLLRTTDGRSLVGEGRKDASYYARDEHNGAAAWTTDAGQAGNLTSGFGIGGFLGSTAVQLDSSNHAVRVVGATAIPIPQPVTASSVNKSTWSVRAMDAATGKLLWEYRLTGPSYGATTIANGVAFVPDTFTSTVLALDAASGLPLWTAPVGGPPSSAPVVVGDSLYVGAGTRETDGEYKAFGHQLQQAASVLGPHPLSPLSGIYAFSLAPGVPTR